MAVKINYWDDWKPVSKTITNAQNNTKPQNQVIKQAQEKVITWANAVTNLIPNTNKPTSNIKQTPNIF